MKDQLKQLTAKLKPIAAIGRRYLTFIVILLFLILYAVVIVRIDHLSAVTPTDAQVVGKEKSIAHPKVDQATLDKINQLQSQNIQVQALFSQARNNPFSE